MIISHVASTSAEIIGEEGGADDHLSVPPPRQRVTAPDPAPAGRSSTDRAQMMYPRSTTLSATGSLPRGSWVSL